MASNQPDEKQNGKKSSNKVLDNLMDSDDSEGDLRCNICRVSFTSAKDYESHMQGQKHQKKATEAKLKAQEKEKANGKQESESEEDEDEDEDVYCDICDKHCKGYISYSAHINGNGHAKQLKKQKLKEKMKHLPDVLDKDGEAEKEEEGECVLPKPYARCNICQKEFSGPESYDAHMKGVAHKKKVKQSLTAQSLKAGLEDEHTDDEDAFKKCNVCQKSFTGVLPYKMHMESAVHKKSVEKKKVAEEMKEFYVEDKGYVCKECKKAFTDPNGFKSHLENNSHEKQKTKAALLEFLNAYPEIVLTYPFEDDGKGEAMGQCKSDSDAEESSYYLICTICNICLSGPESAQDHVKSKKHLNAKKEKKMLKLIKDHKKNSAVETKDIKPKKDAVDGSHVTINDKSTKIDQDHDFEMV